MKASGNYSSRWLLFAYPATGSVTDWTGRNGGGGGGGEVVSRVAQARHVRQAPVKNRCKPLQSGKKRSFPWKSLLRFGWRAGGRSDCDYHGKRESGNKWAVVGRLTSPSRSCQLTPQAGRECSRAKIQQDVRSEGGRRIKTTRLGGSSASVDLLGGIACTSVDPPSHASRVNSIQIPNLLNSRSVSGCTELQSAYAQIINVHSSFTRVCISNSRGSHPTPAQYSTV
ncbi:hypothetical protein BCV70DRAFT_35828 [Testicularia cyperi]|uniref:Uncharacterized protein n=1 Tax=Testicularia cyperi TaxID=1882483 RepID=A0A317XLP1_9BASI|nr:hypothetical protein BCV70DRAFT_35828 [Testicularia cyperi]